MSYSHKNITHHISQEMLYSYAGGSTDQALNLIISQHLHECSECNHQLSDIQDIMAEFFLELPPLSKEPTKTPDSDFDKLWDRISASPIQKSSVSSPSDLSPLETYVQRNQSRLKIKNNFSGITETILPLSNTETRVAIMDLSAGMVIPVHTHKGTEMTLVLSGGFYDETGTYNAGDITIKDSVDTHKPIVFPDEPCRCLVVRYGSLKFTGSMGMIYNPLFKLLD